MSASPAPSPPTIPPSPPSNSPSATRCHPNNGKNTSSRRRTTRSNVRQHLTLSGSALQCVAVIKSFKSKALAELWARKTTARIDAKLHGRILRRLDQLDVAREPAEMNQPGFDFHALRGFNPTRHTVHVNGPWCVTFAFD